MSARDVAITIELEAVKALLFLIVVLAVDALELIGPRFTFRHPIGLFWVYLGVRITLVGARAAWNWCRRSAGDR